MDREAIYNEMMTKIDAFAEKLKQEVEQILGEELHFEKPKKGSKKTNKSKAKSSTKKSQTKTSKTKNTKSKTSNSKKTTKKSTK